MAAPQGNLADRAVAVARVAAGRLVSLAVDRWQRLVRSVRRLAPTRYFLEQDAIDRRAGVAVVLHLYYADQWDAVFRDKLRLLSQAIDCDVIVTLPATNRQYVPTVKADFPRAAVFVVPNRGRDVLPFIMVLPGLLAAGYDTVLKMHTKRSLHRDDGQDWLTSTVDTLIPDDRAALAGLLDAVAAPRFGLAGPTEYYYPLEVNFAANARHIGRVLADRFGARRAHQLIRSRICDFGFFGGTMFWAKLGPMAGLTRYGPADFESEQGQIDGTFAHALERAFSLFSEMLGLDVYGVQAGQISRLDYASNNFPDWFERS